jgi:hypothetical protein
VWFLRPTASTGWAEDVPDFVEIGGMPNTPHCLRGSGSRRDPGEEPIRRASRTPRQPEFPRGSSKEALSAVSRFTSSAGFVGMGASIPQFHAG